MKKFIKKYFPPFFIRFGIKVWSWKNIFLYPKFFFQYFSLKRLARKSGLSVNMSMGDMLPMLGEDTATTAFDHHYIYHPAWAARIIAQTKPAFHADISSTLHFSAILSAFVPVKFYDYRPAKLTLSNLDCGSADLVNLPFEDNFFQSLSCMHTVEHVGLGRYGDALDANGDQKAISELKRVTAKGGNLLFVVPIGRPKIMFNAHRIYSYRQIMNYFSGFKLKDFSLITDDGQGRDFIENATEQESDRQTYGCGCFWFVKE